MSKNLVNLKILSEAEQIYKKLNGLFTIYKPPDIDIEEVKSKLKFSLVKGINNLPCRPIEKLITVNREDNSLYLQKNYADTIEASGYRFARKDFEIEFLHPLHKFDSGIIIGSLNDIENLKEKVERLHLIKVYQIKGRFGILTDDFTSNGKLIGRADYIHINRSKINRLMSTIQAAYQNEIFKYFNYDIKSQEAFELASKGLIKPISSKTPPQIYSIRCIEFDRPYFKIEIQIINENVLFLRNLVNDIGCRLKTYATCIQTRRIKDGLIDLNSNCLVYNDWENFEKFYLNIKETSNIYKNFIKKDYNGR